jgi:hypothetical protein
MDSTTAPTPNAPPDPTAPLPKDETVLPMPGSVEVRIGGGPAKPAVEPSKEGTDLAEMAADTMRAFEKKFYGYLSWNHPYPGMLAVDDAATVRQGVIVQLLVEAYKARLEHLRDLWQHTKMDEHRAAQQKYDEAHKNDYLKPFTEDFPKLLRQVKDEIEGKKTIHAADEKQQKTLSVEMMQTLDRLGLGVPTAATKPVYAFGVDVPDPLPEPDAPAPDAPDVPPSDPAPPSEPDAPPPPEPPVDATPSAKPATAPAEPDPDPSTSS